MPTEATSQPETAHRLRVFLSHASVDKPAVRGLYERLHAEGFIEPWLDEEDLLPGQDRWRETEKAVRSADVVVVCLSRSSVDQAGTTQREIKLALDLAEAQPENAISIIPVKLEACDLPDQLSHLYPVNLFEERGYERLLRAFQKCNGVDRSAGLIAGWIKNDLLTDAPPLLASANRPQKVSVQEEIRFFGIKVWSYSRIIEVLLLLLLLGSMVIIGLIRSHTDWLAHYSPTPTVARETTSPGSSVTPSTSMPTHPTPKTTPAPTAIITPAYVAVSIEPNRVFTGTLPISFRVGGTNLDQVQSAQLVAPGYQPIPLALVPPRSASTLTLQITTLPESLNGEVVYKLQLDGLTQPAVGVALRDYTNLRTVRGVKSEYEYTGRVADDNGPFTSMRAVRDVASERTGVLRNGNEIAILRDEGDGWYLVRILESNDPEQIGKVGWIERWLVDDKADEVPTPVPTPIPPPPTDTPLIPTDIPTPTPTVVPPPPQVRYFSAASIVSYAGNSDSGRFESCVTGSVSGSEGPITGAVVNVNNGTNSFDATTGGGGFFRVCGLGPSNWTAVLYFVPGVPTGNQPAVTVYVNGLPEQHAVVSFTQQ